jgi:hypothetical protein
MPWGVAQIGGPSGQERRSVYLTVERAPGARKPYLGAYRHKITGATFEHAAAQTPPDAPPACSAPKATSSGAGKAAAQAQTVVMRTRGTQSARECATQMARPGLLLDTSHDCEMAIGVYTSADTFEGCAAAAAAHRCTAPGLPITVHYSAWRFCAFHSMGARRSAANSDIQHQKVSSDCTIRHLVKSVSRLLCRRRCETTIVIQRYARGFLARQRARALREHRDRMRAFAAKCAHDDAAAAEAHRRREIARRMHPRTAADFEVLYNELEAWRLAETRTIGAAQLEDDARRDAFEALLHKVQLHVEWSA